MMLFRKIQILILLETVLNLMISFTMVISSTKKTFISDKYAELEKISVLKEKGILTEDEFISEKNKILSGKK
ncbi:MAG: hypothetical protein CO119_08180 [Flavobacteriales bacterium CG_4_9_14_3_um_filter_40_17]|nr:MAG: hypothetical protein CO119_08180 [Flavobacteriales bacterium CG_4_9_14_3_um_filter_40_17]